MTNDRHLVLSIAGWQISVDSKAPGFLVESSAYSSFVANPIQASDAMVSFYFFPDFSENASFFMAGIENRQEKIRAELLKHDFGLLHTLAAEFQFNESCALSYSAKNSSLGVFARQTLQPFLKLCVPMIHLLSNLGAQTDGVFLHASGAIIDGRGFAILGVPEAGKSTSIAMIRHDFLLSDDMVMMRFKDGVPVLHSTPLGPNTDGPGSAPLTTIFYPVKSDHFELKPLSKLKAIEQYYHAQAGYWDKVFKPFRQQHFEKVVKLFSQVQAYEMHFTRDYIDNDAIRKAMQICP